MSIPGRGRPLPGGHFALVTSCQCFSGAGWQWLRALRYCQGLQRPVQVRQWPERIPRRTPVRVGLTDTVCTPRATPPAPRRTRGRSGRTRGGCGNAQTARRAPFPHSRIPASIEHSMKLLRACRNAALRAPSRTTHSSQLCRDPKTDSGVLLRRAARSGPAEPAHHGPTGRTRPCSDSMQSLGTPCRPLIRSNGPRPSMQSLGTPCRPLVRSNGPRPSPQSPQSGDSPWLARALPLRTGPGRYEHSRIRRRQTGGGGRQRGGSGGRLPPPALRRDTEPAAIGPRRRAGRGSLRRTGTE